MKLTRFPAILLWLLSASAGVSAADDRVAFQTLDVTRLPRIEAFFTVTDAGAESILGLSRKELKLSLDGVPQEIVELRSAIAGGEALAVALLFDRSGSMKGGLAPAKEAALDFLARLSEGDRAAVVSFDETVTVEFPLGGDSAELTAAVRRIETGTNTALFDAVLAGLAELEAAATRRKALVILSDGRDTRSRGDLELVLEAAGQAGVPLYTVALPVESDRGALQILAERTGGAFLEASAPGDLLHLYQSIARQLQNQYFLSFDSSFGKAEAWRRIELAYAAPPGLTVAARRDILTSLSPGISLGRMQQFESDLSRSSTFPVVAVGALVGLLAALLLLFLIRLARPQGPRTWATSVVFVLAALGVGAIAAYLIHAG